MPHNKKIDELTKARAEAVRAFKEAEAKYREACASLPEFSMMDHARCERDAAVHAVVRETERQRRRRSQRTERVVEWEVRLLNADGDVEDVLFYHTDTEALQFVRSYEVTKQIHAVVLEKHVQTWKAGVCVDETYYYVTGIGSLPVIEAWNNGEEDAAS